MELFILGNAVPVVRQPDVTEIQWQVVSPRVGGFPSAIDRAEAKLSEAERAILQLTRGIVVFSAIRFKGRRLTRSFMDLDNALFHWAAHELMHPGYEGNARVASYYYHDAFHVRQYLDGLTNPNIEAMIDREVEATVAQIQIARIMGADQTLLDDLSAFAGDRDAIRARLGTGVGMLGWMLGKPRYEDHFLIL